MYIYIYSMYMYMCIHIIYVYTIKTDVLLTYINGIIVWTLMRYRSLIRIVITADDSSDRDVHIHLRCLLTYVSHCTTIVVCY